MNKGRSQMKLKGSEILEATNGRLLQGDPGQEVSGFVIDSRQIAKGEFFIPFKGEHTDGHRYLAPAAQNGAAGAFCEVQRIPETKLPETFLLIEVENTLLALQKLA